MSAAEPPLDQTGRLLELAGVPALALVEPGVRPLLEVLVSRRNATRAGRALDAASWRWRWGGDGAARLAAQRVYRFDGGFTVVLRRSLSPTPLLPGWLTRLERALWRAAGSDDPGLVPLPATARLVYLAVEANRAGLRSRAQLAELAEVKSLVPDLTQTWALAAECRVRGALRRALSVAGGAMSDQAPPGVRRPALRDGTLASQAERAAQAITRRVGRPDVASLLRGEVWQGVVRCRFAGVQLRAGPGTFLPRGASEGLVAAAVQRLGPGRVGFRPARPVVVDVGTGCGAVALAVAAKVPTARVLGIDVDEAPISWARRNARALGIDASFRRGSLLDPVPASLFGRVDIVVANVPCVPADSFGGATDAPAEAYVGQEQDGMGLQRALAAAARGVLRPGAHLLVQLAPAQWPAYATQLQDMGYAIEEVCGDDVVVVGCARLLEETPG
jgi:release factor glutamine methyltransferase